MYITKQNTMIYYTLELYADRHPTFEFPNFERKYNTLEEALEKYKNIVYNDKTEWVVDESTLINIQLIASDDSYERIYEYDNWDKSSTEHCKGLQ